MMSSEAHRARAAQLREKNPKSRSAQLHELAANLAEQTDDDQTKKYNELLAEPVDG